jgi:hypothetical protein
MQCLQILTIQLIIILRTNRLHPPGDIHTSNQLKAQAILLFRIFKIKSDNLQTRRKL